MRPVDTYDLYQILYEMTAPEHPADQDALLDLVIAVGDALDASTYSRLVGLLTNANRARIAWERSERMPGVFRMR